LKLDDFLIRAEARLHPVAPSWPVDLARPAFSDFDLSGDLAAGAGRVDLPLKHAAVLVGLIDRPEGLSLILTVRTADLPTHAGQIAFPGGKREPHDLNPAATALREAQEEAGLDPDFVTLIGTSDSYETVSRYHITPMIGVISPLAELKPDPREVAAVFEAPFAFFMDAQNHQRHARDYNGQARSYYAMPYGDRYVWGATAGILRALWLRLFGETA
jgi:8-oxo-dGTP pyrophosphatase MutT (NUDIX family)